MSPGTRTFLRSRGKPPKCEARVWPKAIHLAVGFRVSETPYLLPDCGSASVKSDESDSRPVLFHPISLSAGPGTTAA